VLVTMNLVQGRWGWHACDYPTFSRIKDFHRLMLRDRRATKRHERWIAKLPHNRVQRHRDGTITSIAEPRRLGTSQGDYEWILDEYRAVRRPCFDPESVRPLDLPRDWEDRLNRLREFYAGCCP
jgi:hypothetical protein